MVFESIASVLRGFAMGAADIVPGVSGGTIALVLGIYERLVASIRAGSTALGRILAGDVKGFRHWITRVEWGFLVPLGVGILAAVVSLAHLLTTLLAEAPVAMASLFAGLVIGSMLIAWTMLREPAAREVWVAIAVGAVVFVALGVRTGTTEETVDQLTDPALWAYFGSGAIAICAMILPGISGSFILVLLGMYGAVLDAVTDFDIVALGTFILGAVVGLGVFSQVLDRALTHHHDVVLAALVGLMAGSLRVLWPWPLGVQSTVLGTPDSDIALAVAMALVGFIAVVLIWWTAMRVEASATPR
ncbi:MAG: DUF368 domain-containing protein [Acidimicrobiia bacterium]